MSTQMKTWVKAAGIRMIKTVAQSAIAAIGTTSLVTGLNWQVVLATAAMSGVLSVLTSLVGLPEAPKEV